MSEQKTKLKQVLLKERLAKISQRKTIAQTPDRASENIPAKLTEKTAERYDTFPLTDIQQAYWIGRNASLELGNIAAHIYAEFLCVNFDLDRFSRAWQTIIDRHEMLRAIILDNGQQQILKQVPPYQIKTIDCSQSDRTNKELELKQLRDRLSHQIHSTNKYPLFEVCAVKLDEDNTQICFSFDLLIADAWSFESILKELSQLYQNPQLDLPLIEISFRDYVLTVESLKQSSSYQNSLNYWQKRLTTLPNGPELPLVKNPDRLKNPRFVRYNSYLKATETQLLKQKATQAGLTLSGLLLAAYAEVLTAWSRKPHFTINLTLFNRLPLHPQIDRLVGDFTSLTLLEIDNSSREEDSFLARAKRIQTQLWEDLEHSAVSGVRVIRELQKSRGNQTVTMPVIFTSTVDVETAVGRENKITPFGELSYGITQTPQVWLDHQVLANEDGLIFNWDVIEEIFADGAIASLVTAHENLLQQLIADERIWRSQTSLILERQQFTNNNFFEAIADRERLTLTSNKTNYLAPSNPTETKLVEIWQELLETETIGINDNFFELGGNSLIAIQLMLRLRDDFSVDIPLGKLLQTTTIAQLAATVNELTLSPDNLAELPLLTLAPEQKERPFPLTDVQQAYWLGRSGAFTLGNVAAHLYAEFDNQDWDVARFERAWQKVIDRHDMLRAIVRSDGQIQILQEVPPYRVSILDLRGRDRQTVNKELAAMRDRLSHQILSADRYPLFEISAVRLGEKHFRIYFSLDLIVADAWSGEILTQELSAFYQNLELELPPLELSFRDYTLALHRFRESPTYQKSLNYWRDRLSSLPPAPDLPLAKNPRSITRPQFKRRSSTLEPATWQKLKNRAAKLGLTPSGILLAAYAEIITAWSKNPSFTINLTLFNRLPIHPQVNELVGDFTSLTLLAVDNSGVDSFVVRAKRIQARLWEDLQHREVSGVQVLREMQKQEGTTANMPVVFTSTIAVDTNQDQEYADGLGTVDYLLTQTPQIWLDHQIFEGGGKLLFHWDALEEIFPEGVLDDMFEAYCQFIDRLAEEEEIWQQSSPSIMLDRQADFNSTDATISKDLLHTLFWKQVRQNSQQIAIIAPDRQLTYAQLGDRVAHLANLLQQRGASPNRLIAIVMEKGWEQVVAALAILTAGAAYVPLDPQLPNVRLQQLLEQSQVELILTQSQVLEKVTFPTELTTICLDSDRLSEEVRGFDRLLNPIQTPEDIAYVIYTSGSTGTPKGVIIDHRGAVNTILDMNRRFRVGIGDRLLALSSLNFDLSVYDIFGTLAAGATIVIPEANKTKEPSHWTELIRQQQVTIWNSVPALMQLWIDYLNSPSVEKELGSLRLVLLSGDWIPLSLPKQIKSFFPEAETISLGGATEASIWSIFYPIQHIEANWQSIPYGYPMTNQRWYVLDENLQSRPVWVTGQLYIAGVGLAKGYWQNPEKTNASFIIHPDTGERLYRTGDLGRYLPNGAIEFLGREDYQIKIRGFRVELGEIESTLASDPRVRQAVVIAVGRQESKYLVAYVVAATESTSDRDLRKFLAQRLPEYMLPHQIIFLNSLPLTANGKIDRKTLPAPEQILSEKIFVPPHTETEQILVRLWQELLDRDRISIEDNFFELGGDSLLAIQLTTKIKNTFQIELPIEKLLQATTITKLAEAIEEIIFAEIAALDEAEAEQLSQSN
ncbi:MAG: amino acid adenylation domain-containing protein [Hydrococcus sp. RU_2_2]|nr:amino acid adenylation domain-containing protein [Hydrococcus sp. RU_2_2]